MSRNLSDRIMGRYLHKFLTQIVQPARNLFSSRDNCRIVRTFRCFSIHFKTEIFGRQWFSRRTIGVERQTKNEKTKQGNDTSMKREKNSHDFLSCALWQSYPMEPTSRPLAGRIKRLMTLIEISLFSTLMSHLRSVFFDLPSTHSS